MKTEEMFRRDPRIDPYMAAVILTWLAAAGSLAVMLLLGVRGTDRFSAARGVLHLAYAAALLLYLAHRRPSIAHLPESALGHAANGRVGQLAAATPACSCCCSPRRQSSCSRHGGGSSRCAPSSSGWRHPPSLF
jgi:hypothetical protein